VQRYQRRGAGRRGEPADRLGPGDRGRVRPGVAQWTEATKDVLPRGALGPDEVASARQAIDRVYAAAASSGRLNPDRSLHLLSAVANCPEVVSLIDHPATFGCVWSVLGWNIHVYHSHLDVHPPLQAPLPFRFDWHRDGGRQNREIETIPRPRLSVKLAYWLSFDRRIWHARSRNHSRHTRKAVFFGYTYRWTAIRDDLAAMRASDWFGRLTPVQRQLLGGIEAADGDHAWGHYRTARPCMTG
jgi:ectoine hydroxylase